VNVEGTTIRVEGTWEEHEQVEQRLRGTPTRKTTVTAGAEQYQLSVQSAALSKVVDQLAGRLGLTFDWDHAAIDAANISVDQLISLKVHYVSLDELLQAVFKDTGLSFRCEDRKVSIFPKT